MTSNQFDITKHKWGSVSLIGFEDIETINEGSYSIYGVEVICNG